MEHAQFKANQTAADYVANDLDENIQEAFELHMMDCAECLDDVEVWRAIKVEMPRQNIRAVPEVVTGSRSAGPAQPVAQAARSQRPAAFSDWRVAASLLVGGILGAAGGWLGNAARGTDLDAGQTLIFNVPAVTRGADDCTTLRLAPDTQLAVLRVPGVSRDMRVVALDSEGHEIPGGRYGARVQPDGSQLLRLDSRVLSGQSVHLEARHAGSVSEPLGCVTGDTSVH